MATWLLFLFLISISAFFPQTYNIFPKPTNFQTFVFFRYESITIKDVSFHYQATLRQSEKSRQKVLF